MGNRERQRQTDRQTETDRDRQRQTETERQRQRQTETETDKQTDRETKTKREKKRRGNDYVRLLALAETQSTCGADNSLNQTDDQHVVHFDPSGAKPAPRCIQC